VPARNPFRALGRKRDQFRRQRGHVRELPLEARSSAPHDATVGDHPGAAAAHQARKVPCRRCCSPRSLATDPPPHTTGSDPSSTATVDLPSWRLAPPLVPRHAATSTPACPPVERAEVLRPGLDRPEGFGAPTRPARPHDRFALRQTRPQLTLAGSHWAGPVFRNDP